MPGLGMDKVWEDVFSWQKVKHCRDSEFHHAHPRASSVEVEAIGRGCRNRQSCVIFGSQVYDSVLTD